MVDFFVELQKLMLNREKEHLATLIPYYETLWQHRDKLGELINEIKKYPEITIQYIHKENYYTDGKLEIYLHKKVGEWGSQPSFHYEIELQHDDRMYGFCNCTPDDEGFNEEEECCGDGCDWTAPSFYITKVNQIAYENFDGVERDIWELEDKWKEDLSEHNKRLKEERLCRLKEQLEQAKNEIELIENNLQLS